MIQVLRDISGSLAEFIPELYLIALLIAVLLTDLITQKHNRTLTGYVALGGLLTLAVWLCTVAPPSSPTYAMQRMAVADNISWLLRLSFTVLHIFILLQSFVSSRRYKGEYYLLLITMQLGMHVMVISQHFLPMILGMELLSISAYALVAYHKEEKLAAQAGIRYLLFGAFSTGIMLFGLSLIYGLGGSMSLEPGALANALAEANERAVFVGMLLVFVGFAFKSGLMPMHFWAPDVYEGAGWPVATFIGTASKVAAFGLLVRWIAAYPPSGLWLQLLLGVAMLTMIMGNIAAFTQKHYRRLLAYSGIGHSGLLLLGVLMPDQGAFFFYLLIYALMTLAAFWTGMLIVQATKQEAFTDWAGLGRGAPLLALALVITMIALAGLPPTAGFTAKLSVFLPIWTWYERMQDPWILAALITGVVTTLIGLFYYLQPVIVCLFRKGNEPSLSISRWGMLMLILMLLPLMLLGIWGFDVLISQLP